MKTLADFATALGAELPSGAGDLCISDVSNNSIFNETSWLFCAIPGSKRDGHDFIPEAIANGAVAAVVSRLTEAIPQDFPVLLVEDSHMAWALACETQFDLPASSLTLSGVTGTNGKTTIAFILKALLDSCLPGARCGLLSTVLYDACGDGVVEAARTTPDAYEFQRLLSQMRANSCTHASMEMSSHGLHQRRTGSAKFRTAIFTNLTGDHLDYHHDMESYYQAKKLLFTECLAADGVAIVNVDDAYGSRLHKELSKILAEDCLVACSKSSKKAQCLIRSMKMSDSHSEIDLTIFGQDLKLRSSLIGEHNAYNIASAVTAAALLGADVSKISGRLSAPLSVPGRLEGFLLSSGAMAFVDYAHTDDALFRVLSALRPLCKGTLVTVFGCGGERDVTKRPRMGAVAAKLSGLSIITSDNPRSEDPLEIIAQIRKGVPRDAHCLELPDRREAIEKAVASAVRGDIVLIAGKGHENYQEMNGFRIHFDDRELLLSLGATPRSL